MVGAGAPQPLVVLVLVLKGYIRVLVFTSLTFLEDVPAVVEVFVNSPLIHPLQGVLEEVPVGLVVPASLDERLGD